MTSYVFDNIVGSSIAFDADNDVLNMGYAASVISITASGSDLIVTVDGVGSVTLTNTTLGELTSTNLDDLVSGSVFIGDNTTSDALDEVGQTVVNDATDHNDNLAFGLGGGDTIVLGNGDNLIFGGSAVTDANDSGTDTITVGTGSNTIYGNAGNDAITVGATAAGNTTSVFGGLGDDAVTLGAGAGTFYVNTADGNDSFTIGAISGVLTLIAGGNTATETIDASAMTSASSATIYGGTGTADSTDGADAITLGAGNAVAYGNAGNDTIEIRGGTGTTQNVNGGRGNDTITDNGAAAGTHVVAGGWDADTITLTSLNNTTSVTVYGGNSLTDSVDGADTISVTDGGALATALLYGNAGNDTITVDNSDANVTALTVNGGLGNDIVSITHGGAANDTSAVDVSAGDDALTFITGAFDSTFTVAGFGSGDTLTLNLNGSSAAEMTVAQGSNSTVIDDSGAHGAVIFTNYVGNFSASNLTFSDGSVLVTNFGGTAATLSGGTANNDQFIAGSAGDTFLFDNADFAAADVLTGGAGNDTLTFTDATAVIAAELANKTSIETVLFDDFTSSIVLGTAATAAGIVTVNAAAMTAGQALTVTDTGAVSTQYVVTGGADADSIVLDEATGNLTLTGNGGGDTLTTGSGNDTVDGGSGDDTIVTSTGDDSIIGGNGADTITAGDGADTIDAGSGADEIRYAALTDGSGAGTAGGTFTGHDTVTTFTAGTDVINVATATFFAASNDTDNAITDTATGVIGTTTTLNILLATDDTDELVLLTNADSSQFTDMDYIVDVVNAAIAGGSLTSDTGDNAIFVLQGAASSAVYYFTEDDGTDTTVNAADFQLLGIFDAQLTAADVGVF